MVTAALIRGAIPQHTTKHLARELGCSTRQARRISEGRVPRAFRAALVRLLDRAIASNERRMHELRQELARLEALERVDALPAEGAAVPRAGAREAAQAGADDRGGG